MSSHPRISFSNDFVDSHHIHQRPESAPSTDFEFSVSNYSMMSADELFFKGKLLPYQGQSCSKKPVTLREELMAGEAEEEVGAGRYSARPPKGWREILGLKKGNVGSRKHGKNDERRMSVGYDHPDACSTKGLQERGNEGGSSRRDGDSNFRK